MHILGHRAACPRRISDYTQYSYLKGLQPMNQFMTISAFVLGLGADHLRRQLLPLQPVRGPEAGNNPWHANTLEWPTTSPPPHGNFRRIPTVYRGPYEYSVPGHGPTTCPRPSPAGRRPRTMAETTLFGRTRACASRSRPAWVRGRRRRRHAAARLRRRAGDVDRIGTLGSRLADHLRPEHVHVSGVQVGGRHPLRARAPPDRLGSRASHRRAGRLAGAPRAAPLGTPPRLLRPRGGGCPGRPRRADRPAAPSHRRLRGARLPRADVLLHRRRASPS